MVRGALTYSRSLLPSVSKYCAELTRIGFAGSVLRMLTETETSALAGSPRLSRSPCQTWE